MTLLDTRPQLVTQIAFTTDPGVANPVWVDTSAYHMSVTIKRGRQRELDQDEAGTANVTFKNGDRRFDPNNTTGPYYGYLLPLREIRIGAIWRSGSGKWLDIPGGISDYAWAPHNPNLDIIGDIDIRAKLLFHNWRPAASQGILGKIRDNGAYSYGLGIEGITGKLIFSWYNGVEQRTVTSTVGNNIANGAAYWIRVTLDVNNGSGGHTILFFTSFNGFEWHLLGDPIVTAGTTSIVNTTGPVHAGSIPAMFGAPMKFLNGQIRVAIDESIVALPNIEDVDDWLIEGTFNDVVGNVWHLSGSATWSGIPQYLFRGFVRSWPQYWPNKRNARVTISCSDGFEVLNHKYLNRWFSAQRSDERINAVLDSVGWSPAARNITSGQSSIVGSNLEETPALEHLLHVALSENGRFFIAKNGNATFLGRHRHATPPFSTVHATFGTGSDELHYIDLDGIEYSASLIFNECRVSRVSGPHKVATDLASQNKYFSRTLTRSNLLLITDDEALLNAQWLLAQYREPMQRIEGMTLKPALQPSEQWPQVLARDLAERIMVRLRPPGPGPIIEQESIIENIEHQITPADWIVRYGLSPSWKLPLKVLGSARLGLTALGY